ncbi:hypothetical protein [Streptococcus iniae]|uniref:hypothetical protein n=1 Tax=Streptococcus iniae TaxID=1346 RepID=UPI0003348016|nr:hypothetical protein [Streptococcus iniae]AGM99826.1 hypothetical protein K710_2084 [Streptococcus iniae SF1]QBX16823.1 hypothetical protein Javan275_0032 [Streptococcus phage Javan275]QBX25765.1 hypothetical protein Javan272_0016 [Streptococcus phage Javan272]ASL35718.1 hypothetical protein QMA0248_1950 [Streptococcus iniae]ELY5748919.1 hypothetical protein [Streptococcus iniae]
MTYEATFMLYGYKAVPIDQFETKELAAQAILDHIIENSCIPKPRVVATMKMRSKEIRIDYGSKTCYYLITLIKYKTEKKQY